MRTQWTLKIAQSVNTMHIELTQSVNTVNIEHCTWNNAMPQRVVINVCGPLAIVAMRLQISTIDVMLAPPCCMTQLSHTQDKAHDNC